MKRDLSTAGNCSFKTATTLVNGKHLFKQIMVLLRWLALGLFLVGSTNSVLAAKTYTDNGDGTVTDPTTGLTWMRCSVGQTWDGSTCTDIVTRYTFAQAQALVGSVTYAGKSDWRLPNIREFESVVDRSIPGRNIDISIFPAAAMGLPWSATLYAGSGFNVQQVWYMNFSEGVPNWGPSDPSGSSNVWMVRGGTSASGLLNPARPTTDYTDNGDGTVTHTPTGLMWQRCSYGQTWTGSTCSGTPIQKTWLDAAMVTDSLAGYADWRLPTIDELMTLIDYTAQSPMLNTTVFPTILATPSLHYWSGSNQIPMSNGIWQLSFAQGDAMALYPTASYPIRLVRAGPSLGSLTLTVNATGLDIVGAPSAYSGSGNYSKVTIPAGTGINLTAQNTSNGTWTGCDAVTGTTDTYKPTCTVLMYADRTVTASFVGIPQLNNLPTALDFAPQTLGTSSTAQSVTLNNTSTATLAISGIATTGDFIQINNCGISLAVGSTCSISVTFAPTAAGARSGSLTVTTNATNSPHTIGLTGAAATVPNAPTGISATSGNALATISFTAPASNGGSAITGYTVTASPGGLTATGAASPITVTGLSNDQAYTFTVTANNAIGTSAASAASASVQPLRDSQNVSFGSAPTLAVGGTGTVTATGGASGNAVTFSSTTPTICTVAGSTVTALAAGNCTIAANQAGNANYSAAGQASQTIAVSAGQQSVMFGSAPSLAVGSTGTVTATGGASGNAVTFSSTTPTICTVSGSTVTALANGACTIAANQAGNANYTAAAQATLDFNVGQGAQSINFGAAPLLTMGGTATISATGGGSGNPVVFASDTVSVCTVVGNTITGLIAGDCVITANQAGNASYSAAQQATQTITIGKVNLVLLKGWNLLGNTTDQPLVVNTTFSDAAVVTTVWKWDASAMGWQFYTPDLTAAELKNYLVSKGYGELVKINPGEGFWINAKAPASVAALPGAPFSLSAAQLVTGWNLVATGDDANAPAFNLSLTDPLAPPPAAGVVPINLTSLWAWDNLLSKWYFYSPSLDGQGGTALADYIAGKGYLDFVATGKTLGTGIGFWVNKP